jgi:hypothetical protein
VQEEFHRVKGVGDFMTLLMMHQRWAAKCYDVINWKKEVEIKLREEFLPKIQGELAKHKKCCQCMTAADVSRCQNMKEEECWTCHGCGERCPKHGWHCMRKHGRQCEGCEYEGLVTKKLR